VGRVPGIEVAQRFNIVPVNINARVYDDFNRPTISTKIGYQRFDHNRGVQPFDLTYRLSEVTRSTVDKIIPVNRVRTT